MEEKDKENLLARALEKTKKEFHDFSKITIQTHFETGKSLREMQRNDWKFLTEEQRFDLIREKLEHLKMVRDRITKDFYFDPNYMIDIFFDVEDLAVLTDKKFNLENVNFSIQECMSDPRELFVRLSIEDIYKIINFVENFLNEKNQPISQQEKQKEWYGSLQYLLINPQLKNRDEIYFKLIKLARSEESKSYLIGFFKKIDDGMEKITDLKVDDKEKYQIERQKIQLGFNSFVDKIKPFIKLNNASDEFDPFLSSLSSKFEREEVGEISRVQSSIVDLLSEKGKGKLFIDDMSKELKTSVPTLRYNLDILKERDIVKTEKRGKKLLWSLVG